MTAAAGPTMMAGTGEAWTTAAAGKAEVVGTGAAAKTAEFDETATTAGAGEPAMVDGTGGV
jgi:hypothetical protein